MGSRKLRKERREEAIKDFEEQMVKAFEEAQRSGATVIESYDKAGDKELSLYAAHHEQRGLVRLAAFRAMERVRGAALYSLIHERGAKS